MARYRASRCSCTDLTDGETDTQTLALAAHLTHVAISAGAAAGLCDRQALVACVLAAAGIGGVLGRDVGETKDAVTEAARYARDLAQEAEDRRRGSTPANSNIKGRPH